MNVYDFDNTILDGDTERYFLDFLVNNHLLKGFTLLRFKRLRKVRWINEKIYRKNTNAMYKIIALNINNLDQLIEKFWDEHTHFIKPFYEKMRKEDDIISSASPSFLLLPIFKRMNIKNYIATEFDFDNLRFSSFNYAEEKVVHFVEKFGSNLIDEFYSDSDTDIYLARLAKKPFKVTGEKIEPWIIK